MEGSAKKFNPAPLIAALLLLIISLFCFWAYRSVSMTLMSQRAAEVFRGESDLLFDQVSVFFPAGQGVTAETIYSFRESLETRYVAESLNAPEKGSLYKDAWAYEGTVALSGDKGSASVSAIGVGGDFFYFHPYFLRSGAYISGDDLARDTVVLDRELAWRLFGSVDVTGMTVSVGERKFTVSGVILRDEDHFSKAAYEETYGDALAGLYMNGEVLAELTDTRIIEYEVVGASPIDSFLKSAAENSFSGAMVVENSSRFQLFSIFEVLKSFGRRSMATERISYPFWENAARFAEDVLAALMILGGICALFPAVYIIYLTARGLKLGARKLAETVPAGLDKLSEWKWKRRRRK